MDFKKEKIFARTFALRERKRRICRYTRNLKEYDAVQCRILPISDGTSEKNGKQLAGNSIPSKESCRSSKPEIRIIKCEKHLIVRVFNQTGGRLVVFVLFLVKNIE